MDWDAPQIVMACVGGFFAIYSLVITGLFVEAKNKINVFKKASFISDKYGKEEAVQKTEGYILAEELFMISNYRKLSEDKKAEIKKVLL